LQAVGARLDEASAMAAAQALTDAMTRTEGYWGQRELALGLGQVLGRINPTKAAPFAAIAAQTLTGLTNDDWQARELKNIREGLEAIAPALDIDSAKAAARTLTEAITKSLHPAVVCELTTELLAVLARLPAADAARHADTAGKSIAARMAPTNDPGALRELAATLVALSGKMSTASASRHAGTAANRLMTVLTKTEAPASVTTLVRGLLVLSSKLPAAEAARHSVAAKQVLTGAMARTTDYGTLRELVSCRHALTGRRENPGAARHVVARSLIDQMARTNEAKTLAALGETLRTVCSEWPEGTAPSIQELVDLLKLPTFVGPARAVVLERLGKRYHRTFDSIWDIPR
jgi:hypothetical protein